MTSGSPSDPARDPDTVPSERTVPTLLEQMGGVAGIVASSIPVAVFVVVNIVTSLQPALIAALAAGVVIAVWRYLPGLIYSAVFALAFLVSVLVRWPLAGVVWHGINGDGQSWRKDPRLLRAYTYASLLWTLVFVARLVVQGLLYQADEATWLGVARLAMGYPLIGVALLGTIWAVSRARRAPRPAA